MVECQFSELDLEFDARGVIRVFGDQGTGWQLQYGKSSDVRLPCESSTILRPILLTSRRPTRFIGRSHEPKLPQASASPPRNKKPFIAPYLRIYSYFQIEIEFPGQLRFSQGPPYVARMASALSLRIRCSFQFGFTGIAK